MPFADISHSLALVGFSSDPDIHFCFHLLAAAAETLVAADILAEDSIHALGLIMPLHHMRNSHDSSVLDCSVWAG